MIKKIKEQSVLYTIMTIAILAFAVFFLCKCWIHISTVPYAVNEYREAADVQLTEAFLKGEIPYRLESLDASGEMPPVLYQYSFLNCVVSAFFALILGGRVVLAHYIVATLSMIGSAVLVYHNIDRYSGQTAAPMLGAVLTLFCHWRFGYLSTTPNSLGIFLTLLTFTLAVSPKIKYKAIITAFMCVLLFYTKLYFITIAGAIFIYALLHDRREAFAFLGMTVLHGALSILLIQAFWPLYFTYSLYFINGRSLWNTVRKLFTMTEPHVRTSVFFPCVAVFQPNTVTSGSGVSISGPFSASTRYVFEQFGYMITVFGVLFAILLVYFAIAGIKKYKKHEKIKVVGNDAFVLALIQVFVQGSCMFILGRGDGAYLSYYLQLWIPYVIIASLISLQKILQSSPRYRNIPILVFVSFISIYLGYKRLPLFMMTEDEAVSWERAKMYVDSYAPKGVYYSPVLDYLAVGHGERSYNNGHTGVIQKNRPNAWEADTLAQKVFPYAGKIIQLHFSYQRELEDKVQNHQFALVTTDSDQLYLEDSFLTENGYKLLETLPLAAGNAVYDVEFWIPEEE